MGRALTDWTNLQSASFPSHHAGGLIVGEDLARARYVLLYLLAQVFKRRELDLIPEFLQEDDLKFLSIEVAGKIEEMRFDAQ